MTLEGCSSSAIFVMLWAIASKPHSIFTFPERFQGIFRISVSLEGYSFCFLGIWVLLLHPLIVKMSVYDMFPAAFSGGTAVAGAVADQCGGGDQHIDAHKKHQKPG